MKIDFAHPSSPGQCRLSRASCLSHRFPTFLENASALNSISALFRILFVSHTSSAVIERTKQVISLAAGVAFSKRFCFLWFVFCIQFSQLSSIGFLLKIVFRFYRSDTGTASVCSPFSRSTAGNPAPSLSFLTKKLLFPCTGTMKIRSSLNFCITVS